MGQQNEALAKKIADGVEEVIALVNSCSDAKWTAKTSAEGWGVNVTAMHLAGHLGAAGLAQAIATGGALPPLSMADIDAGNAANAAEHASCTKAQVIEGLRKGAADATAMVRSWTDEQAARKANFLGQDMTPGQVIEMVVIHGLQEHGGSIRAAI